MKRLLAAVGALGLAAALVAAGAGARTTKPGPPPDGPDLASMALSPSDVHAQTALGGDYSMPDVQLTYERVFGPGASIGRTHLTALISFVGLYDEGDTASLDMDELRRLLGSRTTRQDVGAQIVHSFGGTTSDDPIAGPLRSFAAGDESLGFVATVPTRQGRFQVAFVATRVDRVESELILLSGRNDVLAIADVGRVLTTAAAHMRGGLTVKNVAPPTISGTATQGQTLTADHGHWSGGPSVIEYQWSRCDGATGATCAPIAGATGATYAPVPADVGSRLTVTVTARNGVSSATATAPVSVVAT